MTPTRFACSAAMWWRFNPKIRDMAEIRLDISLLVV
jgi:hypothetical protein